ncbi:MAG: hypothetical protein NVS4B7_13130 [Ktedonobacteraceae bacterium]
MSSQQLIPRTDSEQEELRQARRDARIQRRKQRQRARLILWGTISSSVLLLGFMSFSFIQIQRILNYNALYPPINGVTCDSMEQKSYHIHVHLTIYINGQLTPVPKGIGIAPDGSCFYWMHTHTSDGIIHIEAPAKVHNIALDDFLTIWHDGFAKLNFPRELSANSGWHIYINGQLFAGVVTSPLNTEVALASHDVVTIEYGTSNPPPDKYYAFPANLPK